MKQFFPATFLLLLLSLLPTRPISATLQCPFDRRLSEDFPVESFRGIYTVTERSPGGTSKIATGGTLTNITDRLSNGLAIVDPATGKWQSLAGGIFFAAWNGSSWHALGARISGGMCAL